MHEDWIIIYKNSTVLMIDNFLIYYKGHGHE